MKKHFKKLTTLLLLLTLVGSIPPVQKPMDNNIETDIPVCGEDERMENIEKSTKIE